MSRMNPADVIEQFGLHENTESENVLIAADFAEENGLGSFAQFLRDHMRLVMTADRWKSDEVDSEPDAPGLSRADGSGGVYHFDRINDDGLGLQDGSGSVEPGHNSNEQ